MHFQKFPLARFLKSAALGLTWGLAFVARMPADIITLPPSADTFLPEFASHFPGANGSGQDMVIGTQGGNAGFTKNRGLVRFDLSAIPVGAVINSVTLQLTINRFASSGTASRFHIHRLSVAWAESQSTWFVRLAGQNWATPGGQAGSEYSTNSSANTLISGTGTFMFESTPGLVADVTDWVNLPSSNQGWLIKTVNESVGLTAGRFATRENPSSAPQLTVDYTAPDNSPRIDSAKIEGSDFCLKFQAQVGKSYVVERRNRVETGSWTVVQTLPPATAAGLVTVCDPLMNGNWFYRVGESEQ